MVLYRKCTCVGASRSSDLSGLGEFCYFGGVRLEERIIIQDHWNEIMNKPHQEWPDAAREFVRLLALGARRQAATEARLAYQRKLESR